MLALFNKPFMKQLKLKIIIKLCEALDLIAPEAQYHHSCYRNYTRSVATLIDMERDRKSSTDESQTH